MNNSSLETSYPIGGLRGVFSGIPSDKSISHRACILAGLAEGETTIHFAKNTHSAQSATSIPGDVVHTIKAMELMGAEVDYTTNNCVKIVGVGKLGLRKPEQAIDLGNSGTAARLLMGIIGGYPITVKLTGDSSLSSRPMKRAMQPLSKMGVAFAPQNSDYLPLSVTGKQTLQCLTYTLPVPSAQVKTAILFAALRAIGTTKVIEPWVIRDHTEKILTAFGYSVVVDAQPDGSRIISIEGGSRLQAAGDLVIPADFSATAFAIVAALITPDSEITLKRIGVNPTRTGLLDCLIEMGGDILLTPSHTAGGENTADIRIRSSKLHAIRVPEERVSLMIDEFPILAVAAAFAEGTTHFSGLGELRVKESDRLLTTHRMLTEAGVLSKVDDTNHSLTIEGCHSATAAGPPPGGGIVQANLDHRIAMSTLVLGMACKNPMSIVSCDPPAYQSSFPNFDQMMNAFGGNIRENYSADSMR